MTVIVPVWNRRDLLQTLFESLQAQTHPIAEIVAIDNGSTDGAAEFAERQGARVIRLGRNAGFSAAVNRGIRESREPWIAILNTDIQLAPDWLERLSAAAGEPDTWFAAGKVLSEASPSTLDGTWDTLCKGGCGWRAGHGRPDGPEFANPRTIASPSFTAGIFRKQLFERVGLLDESFASYLEDTDFGLRCALSGLSGVYVPGAVAWHRGSATLGRWNARVVRSISRNQVLLVRKHYPAGLIARFGWHILVAHALWGLVALRHGAGWAWLRGKFEGLAFSFPPRALTPAPGHVPLREILESGDREIRDLQRRTGFDSYWRLYFLLTAGGSD